MDMANKPVKWIFFCKLGDELKNKKQKKTIWHQDNISLDTNTDYYSHSCFCPEEMWNGKKSGRLIITARHTLNVMVILYTSLVHIHFPKRLRSEQDATFSGLGHGCQYRSARALVCVCVWICMRTCDASSRAGRGEMSLWSYLANAAASDKSFISLILRERPRRPCRTPPLQIYPAGTTQRHNSPSLVAHRFLPSFLPHPKPSRHPHLFALPHSFPPSFGHSRQYASLTLANQRFTLDAQMQQSKKKKKGNQSVDTWGWGGDWIKKTFCISYYSVACVGIGCISISLAHSCILILLH